MAGKYAAGTEVPVRRSLDELERLVERFAGGEPSGFGYGTVGHASTVQFELRGRRVRLTIRLPDVEEFAGRAVNQHTMNLAPSARAKDAWQREVNRRWRALVEVVKAKLVAVDDGISTLEREFLPDLVLPSGETVAERLGPDLAAVIASGNLPPLMPGLPSPAKVIELPARAQS